MRQRLRLWHAPKLVGTLALPAVVLAGLPGVAFADTATSADDLACKLSPAANASYAQWWTSVSTNPTYQKWFWTDSVPKQTSACRTDTANTLWNQAAPNNWATVSNIGGWAWSSGGYFSQYLWLRAIPDGIAPVANIGGWNAPSGGYYTQMFWLKAVPQNWAVKPNIGGRPPASAGQQPPRAVRLPGPPTPGDSPH